MTLQLDPQIAELDELYQALVGLADGLDDDQAERARSALLLLLAHQTGSLETVREAIELARRAARRGSFQPS